MPKTELFRSALPYLAVGVASWYIYKLFIKPFLSPLRKIPGRPYKPIIGNMYEALKEEAMSNTINWMKEYKSQIIRYYFFYGEARVLVADPALVKYITVTNSKNYIHGNVVGNLSSIIPGFLLLLNGESHHALRKIINPSFNSHSVNEFIPVFEEKARKIVKLWQKEIASNGGEKAQVAAQSHMCRLTLDVICKCGFDFDMQSIELPNEAGVLSFRRIIEGLQLKLSSLLPTQWLPTKKNRQLWADLHFFRSTIQRVISEKMNKMGQGDSTKDLLSHLLKTRDEQGRPLGERELFDQVGGFLFAGFETTSTSLTWALLMLAEHPDIQEKARQEVMSVMPDASQPIKTEDLDNLLYVTCVIKESLRLFPPVSVLFRKAVHDDYLNGYFIPAGTKVGVSIGALHRLPENWDDPLTFKPERFMEEYDHYKFLPFNAGPYMCIGHIFSLTESKLVLSLLLRSFRVSLPPAYKYRRIRHITMQPYPPLSLLVQAL